MFLGERNDISHVSLSILEKFDNFRPKKKKKKKHYLEPNQVDRDKRVVLALVHTRLIRSLSSMFYQCLDKMQGYMYRNTLKEPSPSYALWSTCVHVHNNICLFIICLVLYIGWNPWEHRNYSKVRTLGFRTKSLAVWYIEGSLTLKRPPCPHSLVGTQKGVCVQAMTHTTWSHLAARQKKRSEEWWMKKKLCSKSVFFLGAFKI
jgi:hypothetical protein